VIYGLTFFFSNFGPNATTYIVPGEVFPTEIRATCHGISSAAGKLGAIVGNNNQSINQSINQQSNSDFEFPIFFFVIVVMC
jgi:hypothetical protein